MSRSPAEEILHPQDLRLPPEAEKVFESLTEQGAEIFAREIIKALVQAEAGGNLQPVRDTVEAWYRTLQMRSHPDYPAATLWAREDRPKESSPAEEIVERFAGS